jgi:DNA-binding response OmpR family regulator
MIIIITTIAIATLLFGVFYKPIHRKKKVLVVDADENILEMVRYLLDSNGFDVKTHTTGFNVPDIVLDYHPNLILLDMRLPGKSGAEICKELKQVDSKLPVVLFSANTEREKAFASCTADDFVGKPFDIKNLIDTINMHVN